MNGIVRETNSSWQSWGVSMNGQQERQTDTREALELAHRKRLAMILRYIATMHHSADGQKGISFVRQSFTHQRHENVLFTTGDFRHVMAMDNDGSLFSSPPFTFYAAANTSPKVASNKRTIAGTIKDTLLSQPRASDGRPCWLRLTRVVAETSPRLTVPVKQYLQSWQQSWGSDTTIAELLTAESLAHAPKVAPGRHVHEIKSFLRQYKRYLKRKSMRSSLEPLYNRLFEFLQQQGMQELVWGFGSAKMQLEEAIVHGPLLEVMVEVELARDGALLVRPRPHTGVALNREVVSALTATNDAIRGHDVLSNLHRTVSELETYQLSPGQPSTYVPLLKRMALELSPGGSFVSSGTNSPQDPSKLLVTDVWCLFHRPKPSTVWARDASALAEHVLIRDMALPAAAWSLTHGPGVLESLSSKHEEVVPAQGGLVDVVKSVLFGAAEVKEEKQSPLLPLPTSESQNRIANLLLMGNAPAVCVEGPPGSGKTHSIANMVCAYLCQGKRVLVTSKGAPALAVLRERLPKCVQELCVDVSLSESTGMRQLQQTVERLADRVSLISTEVQQEQCELLQRNVRQLELELQQIDEKLREHSDRKRILIQSIEGQELTEASLALVESVPWLMKTAVKWNVAEVNALVERALSLKVETSDPMDRVTGYESPPSKALVSLVASKAGESLPYLKNVAARAVASLPFIGSVTKMDQRRGELVDKLSAIKLDGSTPESKFDWKLVLLALHHDYRIDEFHREVIEPLFKNDFWPLQDIYEQGAPRKRLQKSFLDTLVQVARVKELCWKHNVHDELEQAIVALQLDARRSKVTLTIQRLAEDLVEATVVSELSRMFSIDAQSALIRFAQVAGKAKFSRSSQLAKMTQRQRRHRQEYLDAFEKCVRYIPCWILTSGQISDYLPAEFGLFDLVILDEASQSDVTVLPGLLRGKQWLIVGDGKQVSPSENFVSEAQIDSLRAALPESPLEECLLPGRSFFDLCSQAFPTGRVVLNEHFRCAPEIISFSNEQFYNNRLIPLRLPTSAERLQPSIIDIRVRNATKVGKINEKECDSIVTMIRDFVTKSASQSFPRSIGVISLIGDEQSRLIRGRLLDAIGPQKYKEHDILVGDSPTFQGSEKDVVFLSMVCSPGSVPTQSQLMHAQRVNVALSRARDRMVLVRSIDANHVPSPDDIKIPVLEFFSREGVKRVGNDEGEQAGLRQNDTSIFSCRPQAETLLETLLRDRGYNVRRMGIVWMDAICVENERSGRRAAVCIDGAGESAEQWTRLVAQQRSIERVGWKALRVDALSFLSDFGSTLDVIVSFLLGAGVEPSELPEEELFAEIESEGDDEDQAAAEGDAQNQAAAEAGDVQYPGEQQEANEVHMEEVEEADVVVISSDEDEKNKSSVSPRAVISQPEIKVEDDAVDPATFGEVVDLEFLRGADQSLDDLLEDPYDHGSAIGLQFQKHSEGHRDEVVDVFQQNDLGVARARSSMSSSASESDKSDRDVNDRPRKRRRRTRRRLDKYSRDARWYPGKYREDLEEQGTDKEWYDTESDLPEASAQSHTNKERAGEEPDSELNDPQHEERLWGMTDQHSQQSLQENAADENDHDLL